MQLLTNIKLEQLNAFELFNQDTQFSVSKRPYI